jgi:hypothetical protein
MSEQKQSGAPAEGEWLTVEMSNEELDEVVGGLGANQLPAVQRTPVQAGAPGQPAPGQQQGIIAVLIGW